MNKVKPSAALQELKNKYKMQKQWKVEDDEESEEEVQILAGKRPANMDELLERQNEAEKMY